MRAFSGASAFKNPGTLLFGREGGKKQMQVEKDIVSQLSEFLEGGKKIAQV